MQILVPIKRFVDFTVKVRVKTDGSGVELDNVKMSMNPFDEIVGKGGLYANTLRIKPPLCITRADADFMIEVLDAALAAT